MVVASRKLVWKHLPFSAADIVNDNPYFQRKTIRTKGCQIDYLIQTRYNNLFVCEIRFSRNTIGEQIIEEMKEKISRLSLPRGFSCWPVFIHVNGVSDSVVIMAIFLKSSIFQNYCIPLSGMTDRFKMHARAPLHGWPTHIKRPLGTLLLATGLLVTNS